MQRIDSSTAVGSPPTPAALGTPGYFQPVNPSLSILGTQTTSDWANGIQEEIVAVILAAGIALSKTNNGQLLAALYKLKGFSNVATYEIVSGQQVSVNGASFTSSGATSFTMPASGIIKYRMWGAGGAGGSTSATGINTLGGPGGGGGYCEGYITAVAGHTLTITVGAGGATGGASGGTSSITGGTPSPSATGGGGGDNLSGPAIGNAGAGGTGSGGTLNISGFRGSLGYPIISGTTAAGSAGGASFGCGVSLASVGSTSLSGFPGTFPGQGGCGSLGGGSGGVGASGLIVIEY